MEKEEVKKKVGKFITDHKAAIGIVSGIFVGSLTMKIGKASGYRKALKVVAPRTNTKYVIERFSETSGKTYMNLFQSMSDEISDLKKELDSQKNVVRILSTLKVDKVDHF